MEPIIDPISKNKVPEEWIKKSKHKREILRNKIESGKWVLTYKGKKLKRGFSTGTVASAAAKGAFLSESKKKVEVPTPIGIRAKLSIDSKKNRCIVKKNPSDHSFDSTENVKIEGNIVSRQKNDLIFGEGIGTVSEESFEIKKGNPSVTEPVKKQIKKSIEEELKKNKTAEIKLTASNASEEALKINKRFGITDGISLLGTTGFVEPWNDELLDSKLELVKKQNKLVLTTGMVGMKHCGRLLPDYKVIKIGKNFEKLKKLDFKKKKVILCGLPALILKYGDPSILEDTEFTSVSQLVREKPETKKIDAALNKVQKKLPRVEIVLVKNNGDILRKREALA